MYVRCLTCSIFVPGNGLDIFTINILCNTPGPSGPPGPGESGSLPGERIDIDRDEPEDSFQDLFVTDIIPQKTYAIRHAAGTSPVPGTESPLHNAQVFFTVHFL